MSRRKGVLAAIGATVLVAGWLYVMEPTTVAVNRGFSGAAAHNPYFALQRLYTELGVPAETRLGLKELPPVDGALLLAVEHRPLSPKETRELVEWVHAGGRLLVEVSNPSADPFLTEAGLESFSDMPAAGGPHAESRSAFSDQPLGWPRLRPVDEDEVRQGLDTHRDGSLGSAAIQSAPVGAGRVTVMTDDTFLTNRHLGKGHNPDKAWWLLGPGPLDPQSGLPSTVWIVFRNPPPSVGALMVSRGRPVATAVALLCLVGLALFARPFGPRLETPPRDRRHLIEHLRATGYFLWHQEVEHVLLKAEQDAVAEHLAGSSKPTNEALLNLAEQAVARLPDPPDRARIRAALALPSTQDRQRFVDTVNVLETLRRSS